MMATLKTKRTLFIISCIVTILYVLSIDVFNASYFNQRLALASDGRSYLNAIELLRRFQLDSIRPPAYPAFLLAIKYFFERPPTFFIATFFVQLVLYIGSIGCVLYLLPHQKNRLFILLFLLIIINPSYVMYAGVVLSETLFTFLVLLSFVALYHFFQTQRHLYLTTYNTFVLLAVLVRPGLFYFGLASIGCTFIYYLQFFKLKASVASLSNLALIISVSLLLLAWPMHIMKKTYGNYTISYIDKITQFRYLNAQIEAISQNNSLESTMRKRDRIFKEQRHNLPAFSSVATKETSQYLTQKSASFMQAFLYNLYLNFHTGNHILPKNNPILSHHLFGLSRLINMFFVILLLVFSGIFSLGFYHALDKKQYYFSAILLIYCLYCWGTSGISFFQGDRFNIVWMPVLVLCIFSFYSLKKK